MSTTLYVVGFMFSPQLEQVALIRKKRPAWQAGKLNGPGGHVDDGETTHQAMVREFKEETGYRTEQSDWGRFLEMHGNNDGGEGSFSLECFALKLSNYDALDELKSTTDEEVEVVYTRDVHTLREDAIENLPWVLGAAVDFLQDGRPKFISVVYP